MLTGLWNLKDIRNSRQNRSKSKLVRGNAVTLAHGSCPLHVWAPGKPDHTKLRDYMDRGGYPTKAGYQTYLGSPTSM